jgi:hypothetical protein
VIDEISPRSQDSIIGAGEKLACKIVAASLRDRGIDSEFVNLDTIVDEMLNEPAVDNILLSSGDQGAAQLGQDFYDRLAEVLGERIRECGTRVPVITGESPLDQYGQFLTHRLLWSSTWLTSRSDRSRIHGSLRCSLCRRTKSIRTTSLERS